MNPIPSERLPLMPWPAILVIALHNLEEALTAPRWLFHHRTEIEAAYHVRLPAPATHVMYAVLITVTLLPSLWLLVASRAHRRSPRAYACLVLLGVFFANAFVPHIAGALALRSYIPGVATATVLVIPFFLTFVSRGLHAGYFSKRGALTALAVAIGIYILVGVGVLTLHPRVWFSGA